MDDDTEEKPLLGLAPLRVLANSEEEGNQIMADLNSVIAPVNADKMLSKLARVCGACQFGVKEGNDRVCRRYPPQVTFMQIPAMVPTPQGPRQGQQITPFTSFPIMRDEQSCGEFRQRGQ